MSENNKQDGKKIVKDDREKHRRKLDEITNVIANPDPSYEQVGREKTPDEKKLEEFLLPDGWQFSIKKEFRIFISSEPSSEFPTNFVRRCTKLALESPNSILRNAIKNYHSIPKLVME